MICIYEDEGLSQLEPLVDLRPVFDLRCGRNTIVEKYRKLYPREEINLWVRDEIAEVTGEAHPDCRVNRPVRKGRLFLSGRFMPAKRIAPKGRESVLLCGDEVVGFRVCAECAVKMSSLSGLKADLAEEQVAGRVVKWPWDLVEFAAAELKKEIGRGQKSGPRGAVVVGSRNKLRVRRGARVWPGAVLCTENGAIEVDRGAEVKPGSFVEGPCYIGPGTVIDGARVRPGCSFGPCCRVAGEVEASVFQGYSNKSHEGFIGHAFVGEWVNLGALTTNSDLKNAYENVTVAIGGRRMDTGLLKVGSFFGDHAKTAIGTLLNTGMVVGTGANWFGAGLARREIPRFSWGGRVPARIGDVLQTARTVMARRGVKMSPAYETRLRELHRRHARA